MKKFIIISLISFNLFAFIINKAIANETVFADSKFTGVAPVTFLNKRETIGFYRDSKLVCHKDECESRSRNFCRHLMASAKNNNKKYWKSHYQQAKQFINEIPKSALIKLGLINDFNILIDCIIKAKKINDSTPKIIDTETITKIQNHVKKCWRIYPNFLNLETTIILKITLNEDMSVALVDIKNREKYLNNSSFKIMAESARRAVLRCSPLPLKKSDYKRLKEFEMEFKTNFMNVR